MESLVKVERFAPVLALPAIAVLIELASLSAVTASSAILPVVTAKLPISFVPTSKSKILLVVIELSAMLDPLICIAPVASPAAKLTIESRFSSDK